MKRILIKRLVESVHATRHLFCLTRNFDNDWSLPNANDRSLVKSCYKSSFYKTNKTSSHKTNNTHHFVRALVKQKNTHTRYLRNSSNTLGYCLGRVRLFQRYLMWVILTNALTAMYYLYNNR